MSETIINKIEKKINRFPKGKIIFIKDFAGIANNAAVRQSLKRLVEKGKLTKLSQGIYYKPKEDKILGAVYPSIENIVKAIAERDKARIIPTGSYALNKLGLSEQVPMNIVYLTDGSARKINLGNFTITLKKTSPKNLSIRHNLSSLLVQALKSLGKNDITPSIRLKIKSILKESGEIAQVKSSIIDAPIWIQNFITSIINEIENE